MPDGYGTCRWTCGECGETFEASGVVGDFKVDRWRRDHKEEHRVAAMTDEERKAHFVQQAAALRYFNEMQKAAPDAV